MDQNLQNGQGCGLFPVVLGAPGRDPRKHCVGIFYLVEVDSTVVPIGADDAVDAAWLPIDNLGMENVACDHASVVDLLRE